MKFRMVALLIVTLIVAVAVYPVAYFAYKEFYVKPLIDSVPEFVRPYVEADPFFATPYADFMLVVWAGLGISWLLVLFRGLLKQS